MPNEWAIGKRIVIAGIIYEVVKTTKKRIYLRAPDKSILELSWRYFYKIARGVK